jgi:hypothetical protein
MLNTTREAVDYLARTYHPHDPPRDGLPSGAGRGQYVHFRSFVQSSLAVQ